MKLIFVVGLLSVCHKISGLPKKGKCPKLKFTVDTTQLNGTYWISAKWSEQPRQPDKYCQPTNAFPNRITHLPLVASKALLDTDNKNYVIQYLCFQFTKVHLRYTFTYSTQKHPTSHLMEAILAAHEKNDLQRENLQLCKI